MTEEQLDAFPHRFENAHLLLNNQLQGIELRDERHGDKIGLEDSDGPANRPFTPSVKPPGGPQNEH
ncbi:hypothetical protein D3C81_1922870 [compost metagenome]